MPELHVSLRDIPMPKRIKRLPVDQRGFPTPYFVHYVNGQADHRIVETSKFKPALEEKRCWICGDYLGRYMTFLLGPMCVVSRTVAEPPSHTDCAEYAAKACPFLSRPQMVRRDAGLPPDIREADGIPIARNPGVMCAWTTRQFKAFQPAPEQLLFRVGDPTHVAWWSEGRAATRAEVQASLNSGVPLLQKLADEDGPAAQLALHQAILAAQKYLPETVVLV
jgi:hypothetical protein